MKSARSEGIGFQLNVATIEGRPGSSAQSGATLTLSSTLRPRAAASRTAPSTEEKS